MKIKCFLFAGIFVCSIPFAVLAAAPDAGSFIPVTAESLVKSPQNSWARAIIFPDVLTAMPEERSQRIDRKRFHRMRLETAGDVWIPSELLEEFKKLKTGRMYSFAGTVDQIKGKFYIMVDGCYRMYTSEDMQNHWVDILHEPTPEDMDAQTEATMQALLVAVQTSLVRQAEELGMTVPQLLGAQTDGGQRIAEHAIADAMRSELTSKNRTADQLLVSAVLATLQRETLLDTSGELGEDLTAWGMMEAPAPEPGITEEAAPLDAVAWEEAVVEEPVQVDAALLEDAPPPEEAWSDSGAWMEEAPPPSPEVVEALDAPVEFAADVEVPDLPADVWAAPESALVEEEGVEASPETPVSEEQIVDAIDAGLPEDDWDWDTVDTLLDSDEWQNAVVEATGETPLDEVIEAAEEDLVIDEIVEGLFEEPAAEPAAEPVDAADAAAEAVTDLDWSAVDALLAPGGWEEPVVEAEVVEEVFEEPAPFAAEVEEEKPAPAPVVAEAEPAPAPSADRASLGVIRRQPKEQQTDFDWDSINALLGFESEEPAVAEAEVVEETVEEPAPVIAEVEVEEEPAPAPVVAETVAPESRPAEDAISSIESELDADALLIQALTAEEIPEEYHAWRDEMAAVDAEDDFWTVEAGAELSNGIPDGMEYVALTEGEPAVQGGAEAKPQPDVLAEAGRLERETRQLERERLAEEKRLARERTQEERQLSRERALEEKRIEGELQRIAREAERAARVDAARVAEEQAAAARAQQEELARLRAERLVAEREAERIAAEAALLEAQQAREEELARLEAERQTLQAVLDEETELRRKLAEEAARLAVEQEEAAKIAERNAQIEQQRATIQQEREALQQKLADLDAQKAQAAAARANREAAMKAALERTEQQTQRLAAERKARLDSAYTEEVARQQAERQAIQAQVSSARKSIEESEREAAENQRLLQQAQEQREKVEAEMKRAEQAARAAEARKAQEIARARQEREELMQQLKEPVDLTRPREIPMPNREPEKKSSWFRRSSEPAPAPAKPAQPAKPARGTIDAPMGL